MAENICNAISFLSILKALEKKIMPLKDHYNKIYIRVYVLELAHRITSYFSIFIDFLGRLTHTMEYLTAIL